MKRLAEDADATTLTLNAARWSINCMSHDRSPARSAKRALPAAAVGAAAFRIFYPSSAAVSGLQYATVHYLSVLPTRRTLSTRAVRSLSLN